MPACGQRPGRRLPGIADGVPDPDRRGGRADRGVERSACQADRSPRRCRELAQTRLRRTDDGNEELMSELRDVDENTFAELVLAADKPVLVDFWAEWCGPCHQLARVLGEIADERADGLTVVKM